MIFSVILGMICVPKNLLCNYFAKARGGGCLSCTASGVCLIITFSL